jgi:oxygen-dependent protoporphyrinogen oxidase
VKVAIIGAGISGLTTAYYIKKYQPTWQVTIFESEDKVGGKMQTDSVDGFNFEAGSNGFLSNKPDTLEFVNDIGANELLLSSNDNARVRFIYNNELIKLPSSPKEFFTTPLLSLFSKLRVMCEILIPKKSDDKDETVEEFGYRRLGKEFTNNFLDAFVTGVFASTAEKLSIKAAFPAIVKMEDEYGSLFKAMFKKKKKDAGPGGKLMSFTNGVGTFIDYLEYYLTKKLDVKIIKEAFVTNVTDTNSSFVVDSAKGNYSFTKVVMATPSYITSSILEENYPELSEKLLDIKYSPVSVVGFGYNYLEDPLQGFGLLTTKAAEQKVLGVLWDSSIFENRAPIGKKLLRVMIGGARNSEFALLPKKDMIAMTKEGIKNTMGIDEEPDTVYVKQYKYAIPSYEVGHLDLVDSIFEELKEHDGLYFNSNAYYGVGLNDCVSNSVKCAKIVTGYIEPEKEDEEIEEEKEDNQEER